MDWTTWLAFAAASAVMGLIPGPGVVSIIGFALGAGRRVALASVAGMAIGNAVAVSLSLAGAGAILAASALAFTILKWAGATYLIALGVLVIARSRKITAEAPEARAVSARAAFASNVAVGTFHPKTLIFFVAFAPQFIDPAAAYLPQAALLVATFVAVAAITDTLYALTAAAAAHRLQGETARRWTARTGGAALVAAGVATATLRR